MSTFKFLENCRFLENLESLMMTSCCTSTGVDLEQKVNTLLPGAFHNISFKGLQIFSFMIYYSLDIFS